MRNLEDEAGYIALENPKTADYLVDSNLNQRGYKEILSHAEYDKWCRADAG